MCDACATPPPGPNLTRAQVLKLLGIGVGAAVLPALPASAAQAAAPGSGTGQGPLLVDNVRGYTVTREGLREFSSVLIASNGKVAGLDASAGRGVRRVNGKGRVLLPGMHDAHGHVWNYGALASELDLSGTRSLAEAQQALAAYAAANLDLAWITGRGWNQVIWGLGRFPTAADLDVVVRDRPVWLVRVDGHAGVANTAALALAGITRGTPDPAGGQIIRDADGNPTGTLVDTAMGFVSSKIPAPTLEDVRRRALLAQAKLNAVGITSVSDASTSTDGYVVLRELAAAGELTMRVNAFLAWDAFNDLGAAVRTDSFAADMLRVRTVKLVADGALGSRGAALLQPYSDEPSTSGLLRVTPEEMNNRVAAVLAAGYQAAIHAIGDRGNRVVLDAFDRAFRTVGNQGLRHRIEHAQVVALDDIPRFKQLGLVASMQPVHATDDMNMAEDRVGPERIKGAYAWRKMLDQGTVIASGSDFPVSSALPFEGLHAAVTRTDREGRPAGGWYSDEAMTPVEALRSFTLDAAYAAHQEKVLGSLEPGKWADFIIADMDPFNLPANRAMWQTSVLQTWVGGRRVGEYGDL
ncbi:amidohydrolase [Micromonospora sp. CB01531]|uniref:amidohydrolase n=1 Tax=Micromonospora sp. CB01531 TaxID=1718947 RepID=UPI00093F7891|nr:amidohydrolase [Micromonospora sp. CB01531]OKI51486.1 amidohydrolase [Micromonospora sp. CB01531]